MSNYNSYELVFPKNLEKYGNLKALAIDFENSFKENIISKVSKLALFKNLEEQDDRVLNELANQLCVEHYNEVDDRSTRIRLIKNAYWAHAKKGTKKAVVDKLKRLNYEIEVKEWWEYNGTPFTFQLSIKNGGKNQSWLEEILDILNKVKNVRSVLSQVQVDVEKSKSYYNITAFKSISINREIMKLQQNQNRNNEIKIKAYKTLIIGGEHEI